MDEPDRLVLVWNQFRSQGLTRLPGAAFELQQIRERMKSFDAVGGIWASQATFLQDGEPEQVKVGNVTGDLLPILGARPLLGRTLLPEDEGANKPAVIVLSHSLWQRRFGADPAIIGRLVHLDGVDPIVVGVMPPGFRMVFPPEAQVPEEIEAWLPFRRDIYAQPRSLYYLRYVARLRPGVELAQANEEAAAIGAQLRKEFVEYGQEDLGLWVVPMHQDAVREIRPALIALFAGVGLVLLIACANVSNLLIARSGVRQREMALRLALGATRARLLRQLLIESATLATLGGIGGLLLGAAILKPLVALAPPGLIRPDAVHLDAKVVGFTMLATIFCGFLFGMAPALQASRIDPAPSLQGGSRGVTRSILRRSRVLVVGEVALGIVLLVGAGLMLRTFVRLMQIDPGFRADGLLAFDLDLPRRRYETDESRVLLVRRLEEALRAMQGVESAGGVSHLPLHDTPNWYSAYAPAGTAAGARPTTMADHRSATPEYLRTMGAQLLAGRLFDERDEEAKRAVVVVDDLLAREAWPGESAIGRRLEFEKIEQGEFGLGSAEVVGVVRHLQTHSLTRQVRGQIYIPFRQSVRWHISFAIRTAGDPAALAAPARRAVASVDKDLAISNVLPMSFFVDRAMSAARFTMVLALLFGGLAMVLAAIGIYGVVAYSVSQREREFGIRQVLGARPADVVLQVMREGIATTSIGVVLGVGAALLCARFLKSLIFGVGYADPVSFTLAGLVLPLTALAACWLPARRAAMRNPLEILRE